MKLLLKTLLAFLLGIFITGAMLFLPAGTLDYPGAWLFMALLFTPVLIMGVVLMAKNPELLRKRLEMKEREKTQQGVVALSGLLLVARLPLWLEPRIRCYCHYCLCGTPYRLCPLCSTPSYATPCTLPSPYSTSPSPSCSVHGGHCWRCRPVWFSWLPASRTRSRCCTKASPATPITPIVCAIG